MGETVQRGTIQNAYRISNEAMKVIIIGDKSDIAQGLIPLLRADCHEVTGWNRNEKNPPNGKWDLFLNCLGTVAPVGPWYESQGWEACFQSNLLLPLYWLRALWKDMLPDASELAS